MNISLSAKLRQATACPCCATKFDKAAEEIEQIQRKLITICEERDRYKAASPDDIRAKGWSVAVHNDYKLNGQSHTFWLFTKDEQALKGEGASDVEALNEIRKRLEGKKND